MTLNCTENIRFSLCLLMVIFLQKEHHLQLAGTERMSSKLRKYLTSFFRIVAFLKHTTINKVVEINRHRNFDFDKSLHGSFLAIVSSHFWAFEVQTVVVAGMLLLFDYVKYLDQY